LISKTYDSNIPSFEKFQASTIKGNSGELIEIINV